MAATALERIRLFIVGTILTMLAISVPAYLRALDSEVVRLAAKGTPGARDIAENSLRLEKPGVAALLLEGAKQAGVASLETSWAEVIALQEENPKWTYWGGSFPDLENAAVMDPTREATVLEAFIQQPIREIFLARLLNSRRPGVQSLMSNRSLAHTSALPPVESPGGGVLEVAITATAMLSQGDYLQPDFRREIESMAASAMADGNSQPIEGVYLDILSLAKRLNWAQFSSLLGMMEDRKTLRTLVHHLSKAPDQAAQIMAIVWTSGSPQQVAQYLNHFPDTGLEDLATGLRNQAGGLQALLNRQVRIHQSRFQLQAREQLPSAPFWEFNTQFALSAPWLALFAKYIGVLIGAFCWIRLLLSLIPNNRLLPNLLKVEGIATHRQQIAATAVLGVFVLVSEPFLAQTPETDDTQLNWRFPTAPAAVVNQVNAMIGEKIDELTILALIIFFVIQATLYALCIVKLKEIQKVNGSSKLKLKLLDNEDNMFDAGLYVGLGGTVVSLLVLTLNLAKVGLMAAYASTLFGIIFVSLLKIIHVRPVRRQLLIESEAGIL